MDYPTFSKKEVSKEYHEEQIPSLGTILEQEQPAT